MYELTLESENPEIFLKLNLNKLEDICQESEQIIQVEDIPIVDMLEKFKFQVNVLKPTRDKEDFIFLYSSSTFWDYFRKDLHKYLIGKKFSKTLPKLNELHNQKTSFKSIFSNDDFMDSILKLYHEDILIKVWSQNKLKYKDLLYISLEDLTSSYKSNEREEKIFAEAKFPKLLINHKYEILRVNHAFTNIIGYTANEINKKGLNNLIGEYKPKIKGIKNTGDNFKLLFNKKENTVISEVKLRLKNSDFKYFNCYSKLIKDNVILIEFHDITPLKKIQQEELNINTYFNQIQKIDKIALSLRYKNLVKWTHEIYEIMEIPPEENKGYQDNFLYKYILEGEEYKIEDALNKLQFNESSKCIFKVRTGKGNIKYIKVTFKYTYENGKKVIMGVNQDVTDELLLQKEAIRLQENFKLIEESSKIGIAELCKGTYTFTSQIYKMLAISKDKYPSDVNIIDNYIIPEDKKIWENSFNFTQENDALDATYRVINEDNVLKYIYCKNKAIYNQNGKLIKIIGFLTDVTEETLTKKSAIDLQNNLEYIQKNSKIAISTYQNDSFTYTNEVYNILEINKEDYPDDINLIRHFLVPEENSRLFNEFKEPTPESPSKHLILKIKTAKGNIKYLEDFIEFEFNNNGEFVKRIGFLHDISTIIEREKELKEVSEDRRLLLEEVHDRVKNNLQLILSFINIDSMYNNGNNPEKIINKTKNRIQTMALTHEEVYQSDNVSNVNLKKFIKKNLDHIFSTYSDGTISLNFDIESVELDMDKTIPLGLLINEAGINTIKYAFPDNCDGNFNINLKIDDGVIDLMMWDDGIGIDNQNEVFYSDTIGFLIIRSLSEQLNAKLTLLDNVEGFGFELKFKK